VGKSAIRHSRFAYRDLSYTRSVSDDLEVLFFSALSFFSKGVDNVFNVVTGLPVERMHLANDFINRVKGERTITYFDGDEVNEINIIINNIEIVPQPLGTYWSSLSNSIISHESRVGVIDIGLKPQIWPLLKIQSTYPRKANRY